MRSGVNLAVESIENHEKSSRPFFGWAISLLWTGDQLLRF
jgi:hypothetical protein